MKKQCNYGLLPAFTVDISDHFSWILKETYVCIHTCIYILFFAIWRMSIPECYHKYSMKDISKK